MAHDLMSVESEPVGLRLAAYGLCFDGEGRVLLVRQSTGSDIGRWGFPGGGVDPREHPDDALIREIEEETGLVDVVRGPVLGIVCTVVERSADRDRPPFKNVGVTYRVEVRSGELRNEVGGSTDECRWFTEDEIQRIELVPHGEETLALGWPLVDR